MKPTKQNIALLKEGAVVETRAGGTSGVWQRAVVYGTHVISTNQVAVILLWEGETLATHDRFTRSLNLVRWPKDAVTRLADLVRGVERQS